MQKDPNNLAIIIAFYISKFDKKAINTLGYYSDKEAFDSISDILGVKRNYIKYRRDEFDPIHPWRVGWQRPMDKRIKKVIDALQDLSELDLRDIVLKILNDKDYRTSEEIQEITAIFSGKKNKKGQFILRAPTGKQAEEYYFNYYQKNKQPIDGEIVDCRNLGVGYDFRIENKDRISFVEVKGLSAFSRGILFTSKEWIVAKSERENYFLCIISNLNEYPEIIFIQNPAEKLNPKRNIYTTIQISWSITDKQLAEIND